MRASFSDLAFSAVDAPHSPHDYAVILRFGTGVLPALPSLESGAARARELFPRSAEALDGGSWVPSREAAPAVQEGGDPAAFIDAPVDLRRGGLPRQLAVRSADGSGCLVTRFHHAQGDLISAFSWLGAQLGEKPPLGPLELKRHARPARVSAFAPGAPSEPVLGGRESDGLGHRAWLVIRFAALPHREGGPTANDVLAAAALSALREWNTARGGGQRIALWLPVNARAQPFVGFGNGSSRIRVHAPSPWPSAAELPAKVREQVRWSKEHGEWAVPRWAQALGHLPFWGLSRLIRRQAADPRVDMGTTMFSHLGKLGVELPGVEAVEVISHLAPRHAVAFTAVTSRGNTDLTLTWDRSRFDRHEVAALASSFEAHRAAIAEAWARG